jgi:hypothetical protein
MRPSAAMSCTGPTRVHPEGAGNPICVVTLRFVFADEAAESVSVPDTVTGELGFRHPQVEDVVGTGGG